MGEFLNLAVLQKLRINSIFILLLGLPNYVCDTKPIINPNTIKDCNKPNPVDAAFVGTLGAWK